MKNLRISLLILIFIGRAAFTCEVNPYSPDKIESALSKREKEACLLKAMNRSNLKADRVEISDEGEILWKISNERFMKKGASARGIASVPEVKNRKTDEKAKLHSFTVAFLSGSASIASTDQVSGTTEKAVSDMGIGASLKWEHHWTSTLSYFGKVSATKYQFKTGQGKSLEKDSVVKSSLAAGLAYAPNRFTVSVLTGLEEIPILTNGTGSSLLIEKFNTPFFAIETKLVLLRFKSKFFLEVDGHYALLLSSKQNGYETKQGSRVEMGIGSNYSFDEKLLFIRSSYQESSIEFGSAKEKLKALSLNAGIGWNF